LAEQAETCLFDAEHPKTAAASTLGVLPEIGLKDVLAQVVPLEQALIKVRMYGVSLLPPRAAATRWGRFRNSPEMEKNAIAALRQKFDLWWWTAPDHFLS